MVSNTSINGINGNCLFPIHNLKEATNPTIKNMITISLVDFILFVVKQRKFIVSERRYEHDLN